MKSRKSKKTKPVALKSSEGHAQDGRILAFVPVGVVVAPIFGIIDFTGIYGGIENFKIPHSKLKPSRVRKRRSLPTRYKNRGFNDFPPVSRKLAMLRKQMLLEYFAARRAGASKSQAANNARGFWVKETGDELNERSVRRWVTIIQRKGGIELAPNEAFLDHRSCPHPGARKLRGGKK